ncbi:MAG: alkaline phosphatase family protein [Polyangiaceae bacterium]|nr:alkaline phosphatase family protein [Polyangiaceae bacterium]
METRFRVMLALAGFLTFFGCSSRDEPLSIPGGGYPCDQPRAAAPPCTGVTVQYGVAGGLGDLGAAGLDARAGRAGAAASCGGSCDGGDVNHTGGLATGGSSGGAGAFDTGGSPTTGGLPTGGAPDTGGFPSTGGAATVGGAGGAASPSRPSRAVVISFDGLASRYLGEMLAAGSLPAFQRFRDLGASTLDARPDYEVTVTLPNHTSMLTGRPVTAVPGMPAETHHGFSANGYSEGVTLHNGGNPALSYVPSIFDVAHDYGYRTCLYAGKEKFVLFDRSYDAEHGGPDLTGKDDGRDKIDRFLVLESEAAFDVAALDLVQGVCEFMFLHIADLDTPVGHQYGWNSPEWQQAIMGIDTMLGEFLDQLVLDIELEQWVIVATADHGGEGYDHSNPTLRAVYEIPFFAVGPGIPAGADLYDLLDGRRWDPGDTRPGYDFYYQPVRDGDAGNLALEMLGLPSVPGSLMRELCLGG